MRYPRLIINTDVSRQAPRLTRTPQPRSELTRNHLILRYPRRIITDMSRQAPRLTRTPQARPELTPNHG